MSRRKKVVGPESGGPRETLPRFLFLVGLPGPSKLAIHLKAKQKGDPTCF